MYNLEKITAALERLGNPQDSLGCIHVAGTNGKGSVCAMLAAVLQQAGYKVGLYTSPHIYDYTERIKINGVPIAKEELSRIDPELSEFEALTVLMFQYFAQNKVDVVVLETGLGGRLDATNVIKSNLCAVLTRIDYDHTERLGTTLEEITREKEGIIKPGCPVVRSGKLKMETGKFLPPLKGAHQKENLALVLEVIKKIFPQIPDETIAAGLKKTCHLARFQQVRENLIVDACHNPGGAAALRESLDECFPDRARRFVFGCLANKDYEKMASALFRPEDDIYFYEFSHRDPGGKSVLSRRFNGKKFRSLQELPKDDALVIVCGSIYMIKDIIPKQTLLNRELSRQ